MLFNLFGKKEGNETPTLFKDKVYINSTGKMDACLQRAKELPNAYFIAWFKETASFYKTFFTQNGIDENRITEAHLVDKMQFQNREPIFLEHHPLHAKEEAVVNDWQHVSMWVFSAMDEPLFKHFGSDKMIPLIKLFGMKESEAIEHSYVTESIIKGQHKIAAKVLVEQPANSQAEWMEKNMSA